MKTSSNNLVCTGHTAKGSPTTRSSSRCSVNIPSVALMATFVEITHSYQTAEGHSCHTDGISSPSHHEASYTEQ